MKVKYILFSIITCLIIILFCHYNIYGKDIKYINENDLSKKEIEMPLLINDFNIVKEELKNKSNKTPYADKKEKVEYIEPQKLISLGEFRLTAYCPCIICCGKWSGSPTASGVMPVANHTIAVDTNVIPFGTEVVVNGNAYIAEDTGSAIKGNRIDIYMSDHNEALKFGVQYAQVYITERKAENES